MLVLHQISKVFERIEFRSVIQAVDESEECSVECSHGLLLHCLIFEELVKPMSNYHFEQVFLEVGGP